MRLQMVTQEPKRMILSVGLLLLSQLIFGQSKLINAPFIIVSDISKSQFYPGDTICFTIKNKTANNRGYTIEVISISSSPEPTELFDNQLYTAYFNNDTSFFLKLKKSREVSKKNNTNFMMPDYEITPHDIAAHSLSTFRFIVQGMKMQKGIKIKLKITPDLVDDEPDYIIETKPFWLFVKPL